MNKELLNLYDIKKNGLILTDKKQCLCGEIVDINTQNCPKCGENLAKTKLLNINKNTVLKKQISTSFTDNVFHYCINGLFSKGFELYEKVLLKFEMDLNSETIIISDTKYFKKNSDTEEFKEILEKYLPGFYNFVIKSLTEQNFEYAKSKFGSLTADELTNFLHIYHSYQALIPYLRGYKILNYGKSFNLKDYFPSINFNSKEEVETLSIYLPVLLTYDFKNVKYLESIISIYKNESEKDLIVFNNCIDKLLSIANKFSYELNYNTINDTFSVLYNNDISFKNFIRIFLASREDYFSKLLEVKKMLKKINGKFSWNDIEKIDKKLYGTLSTKSKLRKDGYSKEDIDKVFEELKRNPINALNYIL